MATVDDYSKRSESAQPRIVVGVDGSPTSLAALEWAVEEARLRGATLEVVHATFFRREALELDSFADLKKRERSILDGAVAKTRDLAPDITVVGRIGDPPAAELLVDVSKDAQLLVVGSRGLGVFREFTLGSVSQDVVRHAQCPLVIVRPARSDKGVVAGHA